MRFTLRQLSYFVAAGETGSVTRAAEQVNISQPSISAAISHLETEFGVQLFVRHHAQGLSLTPAGQQLLKAAKGSLRSMYELYDVASAAIGTVAGPISVGSFRTFAPLIMPEIWQGFSAEHPDVKMTVTEGSEADLLEGLRMARIDVALTYALHMTPDMDFQPLAELPTYAVLSAAHPLADREQVLLSELENTPFILLDMPLTRQYFLNILDQSGVSPRIAAETASPETLRSYVAAGLGFSLMSVRPRNMSAPNGLPLRYVAIKDEFPLMQVGLASLKEMRRTSVIDAFEAYCREQITTGALPGMAP
ncbi:LysR family transcriptional regulator [Leisingera sp.]|uniref:LysR family transcriptional regulator n=1 Tax=Leisingera sp. TaxID=1879318 RepID=UPI002B277C25|nr:LysR family transcriptional regulator [Leisingera sp.]